MELKAAFFRSLVLLLVVYVTCVCVVLIIIAFVPYVKEAYIGSYLIKDVLLFLTFTLVTVVPRVLQWRFNYTLEHEIANQMPHNDNLGNGILAGIFEQRNFRLVPAFFLESCSLLNHYMPFLAQHASSNVAAQGNREHRDVLPECLRCCTAF